MDLFFIRIPEDLADNFSWLHYMPEKAASGSNELQHGSFENAAAAAKGHQVILLVPGEQVILRNVDIPAKRSSKLLQAVPYSLEEDLASDVDDMHFAIGHQENNITPVAAVEQRLIEGWTGLCKAHGLQPRVIIPDTLTLPLAENSWSVLIEQNQVNVRTGISSGFSCHPAMLDTLLEAKLNEESIQTIDQINVWLCHNNGEELRIKQDGLEIVPHACTGGALGVMARGWKNKQYIDLQQGEFGQTHDIGNKLRPWKWAAIIFGLWTVVGFASLLVEKQQLSREKTHLAAEIEKVYKQTFPKARKQGKDIMQKQMRAELKKLGAGPSATVDFLALLDSSGQTIMNHKESKLESINFRGDQIELNVSAATLSHLDQLKEKIAKATGRKTELRSANSSNNKTSATIKVLK